MKVADRLEPKGVGSLSAAGQYCKGGPRWTLGKGGAGSSLASVTDKAGRPKRLKLVKASCLGVCRHVKIRAEANVFDPDHADYFAERRQEQRRARQADYHRHKRWDREEALECFA